MLFVTACDTAYTPKPRAYFRIATPERNYIPFDSLYPYAFEYPVYAEFAPDTRSSSELYWADLRFPQFKGTVHLSYKPVVSESNLHTYFEDARSFSRKHIPKATAIVEEVVVDTDNRVFGMIYMIRGKEAASPLQFYLTDSTNHFLRGALYFDVTPNNDSLAPVIEFLERDIRHLVSTLQWK